MKETIYKTANGMPVRCIQKKDSPLYFLMRIHGGDGVDGREKPAGIAHLVEHLLVSSSAEYPTKDLLAKRFDELGSSVGGFTSMSVVYVHGTVADVADLGEVVKQVSSTLLSHELQTRRLEHERSIVLAEINQAEATTSKRLFNTYLQTVFAGTDYERAVLGSSNSVEAIAAKDIEVWNNRYINASHIDIIAVGDFDEPALVKVFDQYLGVLSVGGKIAIEPLVEGRYVRDVVVNKGLPQVQLRHGIRLPNKLTTEEYIGLDVLFSFLNRPRSGLLSAELRERLRYVYSVGASYYAGSRGNEFNIVTGVDAANLDDLIRELKAITSSLRGKFTKELFYKEKLWLFKTFPIRTQTAADVANLVRRKPIFELGWDKYLEAFETMEYESMDTVFAMFEKDRWVTVKIV